MGRRVEDTKKKRPWWVMRWMELGHTEEEAWSKWNAMNTEENSARARAMHGLEPSPLTTRRRSKR